MRDAAVVSETVTASLHTSVVSTVSTLTSRAGDTEPETPVVLTSEIPDWDAVHREPVHLRLCERVSDVSELYAEADAGATRRFSEACASVQLAPAPFSQGETRVARHAL